MPVGKIGSGDVAGSTGSPGADHTSTEDKGKYQHRDVAKASVDPENQVQPSKEGEASAVSARDRSTVAASAYQYEPRELCIGHNNKYVIKPVTPAFANEKMNKFLEENKSNPKYLPAIFAFRNMMNECFTGLMKSEDANQISDTNPRLDRTATYDYECYAHRTDSSDGVFAPNKASQVIINGDDGRKTPYPASHITYDGKQAGIAMMGPSQKDMEDICKMALQENADVFVDLISDADRQKGAHHQTRFNWNSIPEEGTDFGSCNIKRIGAAKTYEFKSDDPDSPAKKAFIRTFEITGPDNQCRQINQISFVDWPDGDAVSTSELEQLHQLIDQAESKKPGKLVVNCIGGVGRTGTVFATRHLRQKARNGRLDPDNLNAEVLNTIMQGRVSRNFSFVQYPVQLVRIHEAAAVYVAEKLPATPQVKSHLNPSEKPVQIAPAEEKQPLQPAKAKKKTKLSNVLPADFTATPLEHSKEFRNRLAPLRDKLKAIEKQKRDRKAINWNARNKIKTEYNRMLSTIMQKIIGTEATTDIHLTSDRTQLAKLPSGYASTDAGIPHRAINTTPLAHTQVVLRKDSSNPFPMSANHVYNSEGKLAGIAMQAPRAEELDLTLEMAWENKIGVIVDLTSHTDHARLDSRVDWSTVGRSHEPAKSLQTNVLESNDIDPEASLDLRQIKPPRHKGISENSVDPMASLNITTYRKQHVQEALAEPKDDELFISPFSFEGQMMADDEDFWRLESPPLSKDMSLSMSMCPSHFEINPARSVTTHTVKGNNDTSYSLEIREFTLKPRGTDEERSIKVYSFLDWPDGSVISSKALQNLVKVLKQEQQNGCKADANGLMINCVAGLGRTGTLFAAIDIVDSSEKTAPTNETFGQHTLNASLAIRTSRSDDAIQQVSQASGLMNLEHSYIENPAKPKS